MSELSESKLNSKKGKRKSYKPFNSNPDRSLEKGSGIPKEIANRMAKRIIITTGIPTIAGMSIFVLSYYLISRGIADIPPIVTLISSAICFGAGLIGLSYGILSASWEESKGSFLGIENIRPNISKAREVFKNSK